jgi:hypothetical protein
MAVESRIDGFIIIYFYDKLFIAIEFITYPAC